MSVKTVRQRVKLPASPAVVYETLMDSKRHSAFTDDVAKISPSVGGAFYVFEGYAIGKNLELIPGKKIMQSWTAADWEGGEISLVTFALTRDGKGTILTLLHQGVPAKHAAHIANGWKDSYWKPLARFLAAEAAPASAKKPAAKKKIAVKKTAVKKTVAKKAVVKKTAVKKKTAKKIARKAAAKKPLLGKGGGKGG